MRHFSNYDYNTYVHCMQYLDQCVQGAIDIDAQDEDGYTGLMIAIEKNDKNNVELLIEKKANLEIKNHEGYTALDCAAVNYNLHATTLLLPLIKNLDLLKQALNIIISVGQKTGQHSESVNDVFAIIELLLQYLDKHSDASCNNLNDVKMTNLLIVAAKHNKLTLMQDIIRRGGDINKKNTKHETPLLYAAKNGHYAIVEFLLANGAKPNIQDRKGNSALHYAAASGYTQIVTLLLDKGAWINCLNNEEKSPLRLAMENNRVTINLLLKRGACFNSQDAQSIYAHLPRCHDIGRNFINAALIFVSSNEKNIDIFKYILEKGADINAKNAENETALHVAAKSLNVSVVKWLLEKKPSANIFTEPKTPLALVIEEGFMQKNLSAVIIINLLLEHMHTHHIKVELGNLASELIMLGAQYNAITLMGKGISYGGNVHYINKADNTPLSCATENNSIDAVGFLLNYPVDINQQSRFHKFSALHTAAYAGHCKIALRLIHQGAQIDIKDRDERTPLHSAVRSNQSKMVEKLLENGANPAITDKKGRNALYYAVRNCNIDIIEQLLPFVDKIDHTLLHTTLEYPYCDPAPTILKLMQSGADIFAENAEGLSLLDVLSQKRKDELVVLLSKKRPVNYSALMESIKNSVQRLEMIETELETAVTCADIQLINKCLKTNFKINLSKKFAYSLKSCIKKESSLQDIENLFAVIDLFFNYIDENKYLINDDLAHSLLALALDNNNPALTQKAMSSLGSLALINSIHGSPLSDAVLANNLDIVNILLSSRMDPNVDDEYSERTALHFAAQKGYSNIVKTLLEHKASVTREDADGYTPLDFAKQNKHTSVVKLLEPFQLIPPPKLEPQEIIINNTVQLKPGVI